MAEIQNGIRKLSSHVKREVFLITLILLELVVVQNAIFFKGIP